MMPAFSAVRRRLTSWPDFPSCRSPRLEGPMSDLTPELPRPAPPRTWRDHLAGASDLFDVSPRRLAVGVVALACVGVVGWRMLAPPDAPAEMRLPFAGSSAGSTGGGDDGSAPADGVPGAAADGSPGVSGASAAGAATSGVPTELVVHVVGAVAAPGIQRLPPGSRVADALAAAGDALPGVGPSTAAAIIAHRDANGPFTSVEQLIDVRGIGDAKLEQLRHLVTV